MAILYWATVILMLLAAHASAQAVSVLDNTTLAARSIERIVIVGSATLCVVLGYRLFSVTASSASRLLAEGKGFKIHFSQVGPGVFFALFGSAVLSYALYNAPEIIQTSDGSTISVKGAVSASTTSIDDDQLAAINTLHELVLSDKTPLSSDDLRYFNQALAILEVTRRDLLDHRLGVGRFEEWAALKELRRTDPARLQATLASDHAQRQRFDEADEQLTVNLRGQ